MELETYGDAENHLLKKLWGLIDATICCVEVKRYFILKVKDADHNPLVYKKHMEMVFGEIEACISKIISHIIPLATAHVTVREQAGF
ncbi:MAG TPA: hypothetical protein VIZ65_05605 [Cellvibrionaceae bacterium]